MGDVRLVSGLNRAFSWNGTGWIALAVDENGNLSVPGTLSAARVQLTQNVVKNTACSPNGSLARDASGLPLACQGGNWRSLLETRITTTAYDASTDFVPAMGQQDLRIDLAPVPGPRPLYVTGFAHCTSQGSVRTWLAVEVMDAADRRLGYLGGCGAGSSSGDGRVLVKGLIALQKLPENAARLRIYSEPGALAGDGSHLRLLLQNSE